MAEKAEENDDEDEDDVLLGISHGRPLNPEKLPEEDMEDDDDKENIDPKVGLTEYDLLLPMSTEALSIRERETDAEDMDM